MSHTHHTAVHVSDVNTVTFTGPLAVADGLSCDYTWSGGVGIVVQQRVWLCRRVVRVCRGVCAAHGAYAVAAAWVPLPAPRHRM